MNGTIFVVLGTIGEYSDRAEWPVCYFESSELAEAYVLRATASAREAEAQWLDTITSWERTNPEPRWNDSEEWRIEYGVWCDARPEEPLYPMESNRRVSVYDELRYYLKPVPPGPTS